MQFIISYIIKIFNYFLFYLIRVFYRIVRKKEILKVYRKLVVIWYFDKYDGDDKVKVEKMFIDIVVVKEVLIDLGQFVFLF